MNKIKKSLSVLLSLVMLFTTLCFFVLPETGIKANAARAEIQGSYSEGVNPVQFSAASNTLKVDVNNVSTTVKAKITNAAYSVKINSISATMPYEDGESLTVSYSAGTVVTGETSFTVTGKIPATANSVVRYTFTYDVMTADGKMTLYRNLTGYAYGVLTAYDKTAAFTSGARSSYDRGDNKFLCNRTDIVNLEWDGLYFPNSKYFLYTTNVNSTWSAYLYDTGVRDCCNINYVPSLSISANGISTTSITMTDMGASWYTANKGSGTWFSIDWSQLKSGYYNFTYDLGLVSCHGTAMISERTGSVEIYHLNTANTSAGMSERATAEYYGNLARGVSADGNMNYYVQKDRYTAASWDAFVNALDMAYQVAYAEECESAGFKTACSNASTAYTNLYSAVKALVPAQSSVSYDSLFNLYDWHNSAKASSLNDPSKGSIFVDAEGGKINIKSNAGVNDVYTNFEENGMLTDNLYAAELEPNSEYMLLYKVQDGSTGTYQTMIFPYNADGSQSAFVGMGWADVQDIGSAAGWRTVSFSTGSAVTMAAVRFGVNSASANVTFSDIHLVKITAEKNADTYLEEIKETTYPAAAKIVNTANDKYGDLATPTREKYDFTGWVLADGSAFNPSAQIIDSGISVFSTWTPKKYTYTITDGVGNVLRTEEVAYLTKLETPTIMPTRAGYTFDGWDRDFSVLTMPAQDITVNAKWKINQYNLILDPDNGEEKIIITQDYNTDIPEVTDPVKAGYEFAGWYPALPAKMPAKTDTHKAQWTPVNYTITYKFNHDNVADETKAYNIEETFNLLTPERTGYTFAGWLATSADGRWSGTYAANQEINGLYGDVTLTAQWNINDYTVTWKTEKETFTKSYPYGTTNYKFEHKEPEKDPDVQYTYTFAGWKIEGDESGTIYDFGRFPEITGNITFVAVFRSTLRQYTVTWKDHNDVVLKSETLDYGTAITPVTAPDRSNEDEMYNITFIGWEDISTNEVIDDFTGITVTGDVTYQATYDRARKTYTVTFKYKNANGDYKEYTVVVDHGTLYSSIELPKDGEDAYAEYYHVEGDSAGFVHSHYKANWGTTPETITRSQVLTATYEKIENVKLSVDMENYVTGNCTTDTVNAQKCSDCGYAYKETISAIGHVMTLRSDSATCIGDGVKEFRCENCNEEDGVREEESSAKGHNIVFSVDGYDATCEEPGLRSYKYCDRCRRYFDGAAGLYAPGGEETAEVFTIPKNEHEYDKGKVTTEPTCTTTGVKTFTCTNEYCLSGGAKHTYTVEIPMLEHSFTDHVAAVTPDCFKAGNRAYKYCENCKKYFAEEDNDVHSVAGTTDASDFNLPKEEHEAGDPVQTNISGATCTEAGTYTNIYYCKKCNTLLEDKTETITGQPLGHKFDKQMIDADHLKTAATCNSLAVYYYECSRANCGTIATEDKYTFTYGEKNPDNHFTTSSDGEPETTLVGNKNATCCETGYTGDLVCVACKRVVKEGSEIPTNNDHSAYEPHKIVINTLVEATCKDKEKWTETPWCSGCNKAAGETVTKTGKVNALKHVGETKEEKIIDHEATCFTVEEYRIVTTCLDCNMPISTKTGTGGYNADNHAGGTYKSTANQVTGTCIVPRSYDEITHCAGCDTKLDKVTYTLSVDVNNHKGETKTVEESVTEATCKTVRTWTDVTYCCDCKTPLTSISKTGEKNPDNHTDTTKLLGYKEATCKEDGYTGDLYWACCDALYAEGSVIPKHNNHTPGEPVKENEIPATETSDGQYDSVVYCTVCETELSRETIYYHIERTITFILKDSTVVVKAYRGDKVTPPETPEVISPDGFYHLFMHWDKTVKPVTGDATYTAIYTEPCDYDELDRLERVLHEIMDGGLADPALVALFKDDIDAAFKAIDEVNKDRRFRDVSEQSEITVVTDMLEELVYTVYPDYGSTLVIEASSVLYTGRALDIKAVKMPSGSVIGDVVWSSSDEDIAFVANGKLYAIGTGTVTITAERGKLKASKVISIIEGGNTRGVNFTTVDSIQFIIEDYYTVDDTAVLYWTDEQPLRFTVNMTQAGLFDYYTVYINGVPAEMSRDGYYIIPAAYGDARVTIIGEVDEDYIGSNGGSNTVSKWSFWEWILSFFRKIGDFFTGLFS